MKSKEMLNAILNKWSDIAYSAGIAQAELERELGRRHEAYLEGAACRDDEVAELKSEVNRLVNEVHELVEQVNYMESKLRDQHLDSYNAGVQTGRESEVTKATVKMSDAAARTIFAGERGR